jgi:hypothetical protein
MSKSCKHKVMYLQAQVRLSPIYICICLLVEWRPHAQGHRWNYTVAAPWEPFKLILHKVRRNKYSKLHTCTHRVPTLEYLVLGEASNLCYLTAFLRHSCNKHKNLYRNRADFLLVMAVYTEGNLTRQRLNTTRDAVFSAQSKIDIAVVTT